MHIFTFTFRNELFAVDALAVREIIWLPELTPVEEAPDHVVGVFNLRGRIVPVLDLNLRLGHEQERYLLSDRVIILECGIRDEECGIIVNDVHDVVSISGLEIESIAPNSELRTPNLLLGEARVGEEIVMLLDHKAIAESRIQESEVRMGKTKILDSKFSPEESALFHSRALSLMKQPEEMILSERHPFAVVSLSGEYFGVQLDMVREFSDVRDVTPVPCTPPHIVGDMNLRGEIVTVVDIRGMLNISNAEFGMRKAVIAQVNDLVAGIAVDDVVEVIEIVGTEVVPVPEASAASANGYIKGEFPYGGKMLSVLDLGNILTSGEMVVEG